MSARPLVVALVVCGCGYDVPLGAHDGGSGTCGDELAAGLFRDSTFGSCGAVTVDIGGVDNVGYGAGSFALDSQDRPVIATTAGSTANRNFATLRLDANGARDLTFGDGGVVAVNAGLTLESAVAVLVGDDGKITSAGFAISNTAAMEPKALMMRMLPSGALDPTLNGSGVHFPGHFGTHEICNALVPRPGGGILCGGHGWPNFPGQTNLTLLSRKVDGGFDESFGSNADGFATFDFSGGDETGGALALLSDGRVLLAGSTHSAAGSFDMALLRVLPNGALDPTFTRVAADFSGGDDRCESVTLLASGAAICAGSAGGAGALLKVGTTGALDTSFGSDGRVTVPAMSGIAAVLELADGGLLVAGEAGGSAALLELSATGAVVAAPPRVVTGANRIWALRRGSDGRVWAFGVANEASGNNDIFVMRLTTRESARFGVAGQCSATGVGPMWVLLLMVVVGKKRGQASFREQVRDESAAAPRKAACPLFLPRNSSRPAPRLPCERSPRVWCCSSSAVTAKSSNAWEAPPEAAPPPAKAEAPTPPRSTRSPATPPSAPAS